MKILKQSNAGTLESSDIYITLSPNEGNGIEIELVSIVLKQFGDEISSLIEQTLKSHGIKDAKVDAIDKGALDCTIRARVTAAAMRAVDQEITPWGGQACQN